MKPHLSRRRLVLAGCAAAAVLFAVPAGGALGLTGSAGPAPRPTPLNTPPNGPKWEPPTNAAPRSAAGYRAYVALAGGYNVSTVDVASHTIIANNIRTDAAQGVAATPDGRKVYVANTGQYHVLVVDPVTAEKRPVHVGPYPQDVAVSPDGRSVYATVTGGDTGPGGSDEVAVIDTAEDDVVRRIHVGTSPRQVTFARDGSRAYVTFDGGVAVIDTRSRRVVHTISDPDGAQGVAVTPDGRTLLVTEPRTGKVAVFDAATGRSRGTIRAGDQPWCVAVTSSGKAYVSQMNDGLVAVVDTPSRKVVRTIEVGKLPSEVAVTPDGAEVWVGNVFSGSVSVISTATDAVTATIVGGSGTKPIDAAPLGIAFARAPEG